jgi:hypothetical protein
MTVQRISGPKRGEVVGGWRKLRNERLHNLYSLPDVIIRIKSRRMRWTSHAARMGKKMNAYRAVVGNTEGEETIRKS